MIRVLKYLRKGYDINHYQLIILMNLARGLDEEHFSWLSTKLKAIQDYQERCIEAGVDPLLDESVETFGGLSSEDISEIHFQLFVD